MSKIKLCCLIDPIPLDVGIIKLFEIEKYGKPIICQQCYDNLIDKIPEAIRDTPTKGVWEAIIEYVHLKIKQDHLNDS